MSIITDLTGTTWYFNKSLKSISRATYDVNFVSNSHEYSTLKTDVRSSGILLSYNPNINGIDDVAYESSSWTDAAFRTITFLGGTDATNSTLISVIQSNATNVAEMLVSSVQLPGGEVYKLKDAISGYITADNIKPGENIIFTEDSEGNTVINGAGGGGGSSTSYVDQHVLVINTDILVGDEVDY